MSRTLEMLKRIAQGRPVEDVEPLQREEYAYNAETGEGLSESDDIEVLEPIFDEDTDVEVKSKIELTHGSEVDRNIDSKPETEETQEKIEVCEGHSVSGNISTRIQSVMSRAYESEETFEDESESIADDSFANLAGIKVARRTTEDALNKSVLPEVTQERNDELILDKSYEEACQVSEEREILDETSPESDEETVVTYTIGNPAREADESSVEQQSEEEIESEMELKPTREAGDQLQTEGIHPTEIPPFVAREHLPAIRTQQNKVEETAEEGETLEIGQPNVKRLINGDLLPMTSFHLRYVDNFQLMNEAIISGEVRLVLRRGNPHVTLTPEAIDKLIHSKVHEANVLRQQLEEIDKQRSEIIGDLGERIAQIEKMKLLRYESKKHIDGDTL